MRFFVEIAYDGTAYSGWQVQPNKQTIQGQFNRILSQIHQEEIHVVGCGRTDAGVHASQYFFHFDTQKRIHIDLAHKLNQMLPADIVAYRVFDVEEEQHSRFNAIQRAYTYHMHFERNPFRERFSSYCYHKNLKTNLMKEAATLLTTYTDFAPVSKVADEQLNTLCTVQQCNLLIVEEQARVQLHVSANRFLHNMIRRIMGLLVSVGREKISISEIKEVFESGSELSLNVVSPPQGLFLSKVSYPFIKKEPPKGSSSSH